jgi:hypothetical protein
MFSVASSDLLISKTRLKIEELDRIWMASISYY